MSIIAGLTGAVGVIGAGTDLINKGTCGKKCYGFGKSLRKCRDKRSADCARVEKQKAKQKADALEAEARILQAKKQKANLSTSNSPSAQMDNILQKPGALVGIAIVGFLVFFQLQSARK